MPASSSSACQRDRSPPRGDQEAEMKPLTAGFPGKKLSWQLPSLETVGEREREEVSQIAETQTRKQHGKRVGYRRHRD